MLILYDVNNWRCLAVNTRHLAHTTMYQLSSSLANSASCASLLGPVLVVSCVGVWDIAHRPVPLQPGMGRFTARGSHPLGPSSRDLYPLRPCTAAHTRVRARAHTRSRLGAFCASLVRRTTVDPACGGR